MGHFCPSGSGPDPDPLTLLNLDPDPKHWLFGTSLHYDNCLHFPQEIDHSGAGRRRPQEVHCRPEEPLRGLNHPPPPAPTPLSLCFRHVKKYQPIYITDVYEIKLRILADSVLFLLPK